MSTPVASSPNHIAVVGMACRFPGAPTPEQFWENLCAGRESIRFFSESELLAAGTDPALLQDPHFVPTKPVIEGVEFFDAAYFGVSPREAELTDPQQRVFLEVASEALERAGLDPGDFARPVGIFAGTGISAYLLRNLLANPAARREAGGAAASTGNLPDCLATRAAYKLNLRGPAYAVQCACSTSLVAVHAACQSLLGFECDAALAGGVAIQLPQIGGYLHQADGVVSPDGHCRPFDARAGGTLFGNGAGAVVLMRLDDARREGYPVAAVIRGTAVNNDGALKAGFAAPSLAGQAAVIDEALANAGIESAEAISYVEAHGTATALGDPVEVAALTRAFRATTAEIGFCALGSVKSNLGHLDAAGGVAGLIKTVLALQHRKIPPSLHFTSPNPRIDFASSPFFVNAALRDWAPRAGGRRAGISAFGVGGTNAHAVVEEAPAAPAPGQTRPVQLLVWSAKTAGALEAMTAQLADFLESRPGPALADVAHTLQRGRRPWEHRRALVAESAAEAAAALRALDPARVPGAVRKPAARRLTFLFPGQGAQYAGMGRRLYAEEPGFRREVDRCCDLLLRPLGFDLRSALFPAEAGLAEANRRLRQIDAGEPALFVIGYALARLWMEWGVVPQAMIGHSVGEYVAATLADVFTLEDALLAVASRARLIQALPPGEMLAVPLPPDEVRPHLNGEVSLALVNAARACVLAGSAAALAPVEKALEQRGVPVRRLETSRALHSPMIEAMLPEFARILGTIPLQAPRLPFISNLTGRPITAGQARDPAYWVRQARQTVYFADGIGELLQDPERIFLEVGPGMVLSNLVRQNPGRGAGRVILNSLPDPRERKSEMAGLLATLGRLWLAGVDVDWKGFSAGEERQRIVLPTYPFERRKFWIDPDPTADPAEAGAGPGRKNPPRQWFYLPIWKHAPAALGPPPAPSPERPLESTWLVLGGQEGLAPALAAAAAEQGAACLRVRSGADLAEESAGWRLRPDSAADYGGMLGRLRQAGRFPSAIIDAWGLPGGKSDPTAAFHRLFALCQALAREPGNPTVRLAVISDRAAAVRGDESLNPGGAATAGLSLVAGQEAPFVATTWIDVEMPAGEKAGASLARQIAREVARAAPDPVVAFRGGQRWSRGFQRAALPESPPATAALLRPKGVYLVTGGLGGLGLALADSLAGAVLARLVLVARRGLPPRQDWEQLLAAPGTEPDLKEKLRKIRGMEAKGSEVLVLAADIAGQGGAQSAVAAAISAFGRLDGVIHAAGVAGGGVIPLRTREACDRVLAPKIAGTLALEAALAGVSFDFLALFSSLAAVCGGPGQADYSSANAFLDGFAWSRRRLGRARVLSIGWDLWRGTGMAAPPAAGARRPDSPWGLEPPEGVAAFHRALDLDYPQILVSTVDLEARLAAGNGPAAVPPARRHPRPAQAAPYLEPSGEWERRLAELWGAALGIGPIGALDNFFDLGGDSLSALGFAAALKQAHGRDILVTDLYELPTVRLLAERLGADGA